MKNRLERLNDRLSRPRRLRLDADRLRIRRLRPYAALFALALATASDAADGRASGYADRAGNSATTTRA